MKNITFLLQISQRKIQIYSPPQYGLILNIDFFMLTVAVMLSFKTIPEL